MATTFDCYIDQPSTCIQHAKMVRAVLPNSHTRYVVTYADLSKYLEEVFGSDFEFNIEVCPPLLMVHHPLWDVCSYIS